MTRSARRPRHLSTLLVLPFLLAAAACGQESATDPGSDPGSGSSSADTDIAHASGADDVVLLVDISGGFVTPQIAFGTQPVLQIMGDGTAYLQAPVAEIYPGPLLQPLTQVTLSEEQVQQILKLAQDDGLLADPPEYAPDPQIADAPTTTVRLTTDEGTFEHAAYALGLDPTEEETDADRKQLADFVTDVQELVQPQPGDPLVPEVLRVRATPVDELPTGEPEPTVTRWPAGGGDLAGADTCLLVDDEMAVAKLADATQLTYFTQGGVTYELAAAIVLPGSDDCSVA